MAIHIDNFLCEFIELFLTNFQKIFCDFKKGDEMFHVSTPEHGHWNWYNISPITLYRIFFLKKITIDANRKTDPSLPPAASEKYILQLKIKPSPNLKTATISELLKFNKIIAKITYNCSKLKFQKLLSDLKLICSYRCILSNLTDGGSQGLYLVFLVGDNDHWQSNGLNQITWSSVAVETLAMLDVGL